MTRVARAPAVERSRREAGPAHGSCVDVARGPSVADVRRLVPAVCRRRATSSAVTGRPGPRPARPPGF